MGEMRSKDEVNNENAGGMIVAVIYFGSVYWIFKYLDDSSFHWIIKLILSLGGAFLILVIIGVIFSLLAELFN